MINLADILRNPVYAQARKHPLFLMETTHLWAKLEDQIVRIGVSIIAQTTNRLVSKDGT